MPERSANAAEPKSGWTLLLGLLVLVVTASTLFAREGTEPDVDRPWTWSMEERIQQRMNPQENARRWEAFLQANSKADSADRTRIVIDGSRDPELFLPGELIRHLLSTAFAPEVENQTFWRQHFERDFGASLPSDFWTVLEALAHDYLESQDGARGLATGLDSADSLERESILAEIERLQLPQCLQIVEIHSRAQETWGELFARFLYLGVAPGLQMTTDQTRSEMEFVAGGCR